MSLSDVEIAAVVRELTASLVGRSVGKIFQPDAHTLHVEIGGERLVIAAHPRAARLHVTETRPKMDAPSAFAMLLRKHLGGLRLHSIDVAPGERVVTFGFGAGKPRLVAELTGAHANVFLVGDDDQILGHQKGSGSTTRVLSTGNPYAPPTPAPADARWRGQQRFTTEAEVAAHYEATLRAADEKERRDRLRTQLAREIAKIDRRLVALDEDLRRVTEAAGWRKLGDLLLAHARELPGRGATSVTLPDDFEDGSPLTIVLDPALDGRQNAARFYKQHKRLAAGRKLVEKRQAEARAARAALAAKLANVAALPVAELPAAPPPRARRRDEPEERLPYRELASLSGDAIWVGRSAADNDTLTFRHARGGDLWLHVRDAPGPHVIVPLRSGKPVSEITLVDAATLAAAGSPLKREEQVDVTYTLVKHVRKPKNAKPGLVFASETKTIRVRLEPERITRLMREEPKT